VLTDAIQHRGVIPAAKELPYPLKRQHKLAPNAVHGFIASMDHLLHAGRANQVFAGNSMFLTDLSHDQID
jgi:hypothetical protein